MRVTSRKDIERMSPEARALLEPLLEAQATATRKPARGLYTGLSEADSLRQRLIAVRMALDEGDFEAARRISTIGK